MLSAAPSRTARGDPPPAHRRKASSGGRSGPPAWARGWPPVGGEQWASGVSSWGAPSGGGRSGVWGRTRRHLPLPVGAAAPQAARRHRAPERNGGAVPGSEEPPLSLVACGEPGRERKQRAAAPLKALPASAVVCCAGRARRAPAPLLLRGSESTRSGLCSQCAPGLALKVGPARRCRWEVVPGSQEKYTDGGGVSVKLRSFRLSSPESQVKLLCTPAGSLPPHDCVWAVLDPTLPSGVEWSVSCVRCCR